MRTILWALIPVVTMLPEALPAPPLTGTAFVFQGQLKLGGVPVSGQADMKFALWDAEVGGHSVQSVGASFIDVVDGLFTVELDFGADVFNGEARWLGIVVEFPSGEGNWTELSPRQPLTPTPYALQTRGLFCNQTGEVGIGTTNPQSPLHVVSNHPRTLRVRNASASGGVAILAEATAGSGYTMALDAYTSSADGSTIYAFNEAESGTGHAVFGEAASPNGVAIYGLASNGSERSTGVGVHGRSDSDDGGTGVYGEATSLGGTTYGVRGVASAGSGVRGDHQPTGNYGSLGTSTAGVYGRTSQSSQYGVRGHTGNAMGYAGYFTGGRNYFEGNVGVGLTDPAERLHVAGGDARVDGDVQLYENGALAIESNPTAEGKSWQFRNTSTSGRVAEVGISGTDGAGFVAIRDRTGLATTVEIDGDRDDTSNGIAGGLVRVTSTGGGPGGELAVQNDDGSTTIQALGGATGRGGTLEMFNEAGGGTILLDADDTNDGAISLLDAAGNAGVRLRADHASGIAGEVSLYNDSGFETVELIAAEGAANGAQITLRDSDGTRTVRIDAEYGDGGGAYVELYGGTDDPALYVEGRGATKNNAALRVHNTEPIQGMAAYLTNASTYATMHVQNDGTGETLWLQNTGGGHLIVARSADRSEFWVDGDGYTNVRVLRIHGGADLSEGFDVRGSRMEPSDEVERAAGRSPEEDHFLLGTKPVPGMVVSIDPENPGQLAVSNEPYDRKVAGIISGAGGVQPGMLMGQVGSDAVGDYPIALTGRVYCLCAASGGPVKPGDLLTTSDVPGHAMKVTDYAKAQGAIIGKAMTSLNEEQGLVLVLVGLQ